MSLGYADELYLLAFDHRRSLERMLGIEDGRPTRDEISLIIETKLLIYEGFERAATEVRRGTAGVLVDSQYGSEVARKAREAGYPFAMPVEKSGQAEFDFEHGADFGNEIEDFDPTFSKALVRFNPEGDRDMNGRQTLRLRRLSEWLHEREREFLLELIVPPEQHQLESVRGDRERFDGEWRPELSMRAIEELQEAGVEPDIWKVEGIANRNACRRIADLVRRDGRDLVGCVVLGRGASDSKIDEWLQAASGLPGYTGFAIGRSIFSEVVTALVANGCDRETGVELIARKYRRLIDVYESAAAGKPASAGVASERTLRPSTKAKT